MAQTIYDILTDEPWQLSTHTQGRRAAYINSYHWAIISKYSGTYLYRSSDLGQTWILKGTILAHTSSMTVFSLHLHAVPDSDLFYWSAHVYKTGGVHNIYVGSVDLSDPDNPVISGITDVSDQTTTTGCYYAQITLSGAGYFYLSYMTTRDGGSPYHQYYTLMSNDYTNWVGSVELNIGNSTVSVGRIVMERRRGLNGLCVLYISAGRVRYRYNNIGNSNVNGNWTAESNVTTTLPVQPPTSTWLRYKNISVASQYDGTLICAIGMSSKTYIYTTSTFSGVWTAMVSVGSATPCYYNTLSIVDAYEEVLVLFYSTSTTSYIYVRSLQTEENNIVQIGAGGDILYYVSSPEYVPSWIKYAIPLFSEHNTQVAHAGRWTSNVRDITGILGWGSLTMQNEIFTGSSHGSGQTYYIETRTGPDDPPNGAWTAVTEIAPYTYQVNSALGDYIQIRINYSNNTTLHKMLIPLTSVSDASPLPIMLMFTGKILLFSIMGTTWYQRYGVFQYVFTK